MGYGNELRGVYYDGQIADPREVSFVIDRVEPSRSDSRANIRGDDYYRAGLAVFLEIRDIKLGHEIAHWELDNVYAKPGHPHELRLAAKGSLVGARLVISNPEMVQVARKRLPYLALYKKKQRAHQLRTISLATLAMASVVVAYIYGIPLLAGQIVGLIPPETEARFGDTIVTQMANAFADEGGLTLCDPDPDSLANTAIRRFATQALEGTNTPFSVDIQVVANSIPNAFALPGGHAFYFSGLLEETETADEFAGVMAHEIGHVVHRHGMQQLISTAGTGLLVGFVFGDITGLSIAGGLGAALINSSFSREAEREADAFSLQVANQMNFNSDGLVNLLDRVGEDDEFSKAFALLSTHPLNQERRVALYTQEQIDVAQVPAFSQEEWLAISTMCKNSGSHKTKTK
jgi:Zn-dependent protease with chaperone function